MLNSGFSRKPEPHCSEAQGSLGIVLRLLIFTLLLAFSACASEVHAPAAAPAVRQFCVECGQVEILWAGPASDLPCRGVGGEGRASGVVEDFDDFGPVEQPLDACEQCLDCAREE